MSDFDTVVPKEWQTRRRGAQIRTELEKAIAADS